jgi:hypothetical protein
MATLTNAYATADEYRAALQIRDVTDDDRLIIALNAASRQVDAYTGRRFWQDGSVATRQYRAMDHELVVVDDISTVTGLVVKIDDGLDGTFATTLTITTHFVLEPFNAADDTPVRPYEEITLVDSGAGVFPCGARPGVQVTASFGWPAVPDDVKLATIIQAQMLYKAGDAALGVLQGGIDGNSFRVGRVHPTAVGLLESFVRLNQPSDRRR